MKVAFLGIGLMGAPMASRLLQAGNQLIAWNRTRSKAEALVQHGAQVAASPAEAAAAAQVVVSILENAPVVEHVLFDLGAAHAAKRGTLFIDMSSIAPDRAREHCERLGTMGHAHIDAPVSGGPGGAQEGSLAIMVGGNPVNFERARPTLLAMGRPTLVGPSGAGQLAKLTSQMILSATLSAVAEALLMARAEGIDPLRICDALAGGFADSKVLQIHGRRMAARDFQPGGHVHTFLKDLSAARSIADGHRLQLPVASAAFGLVESLSAHAATSDIAAMALELEMRNPPHRIGIMQNDLKERSEEAEQTERHR